MTAEHMPSRPECTTVPDKAHLLHGEPARREEKRKVWGGHKGGFISKQRRKTHMEAGNVLPIQRLVDGQLSGNGVDDENASRWLVGTGTRHAVSQGAVLIVVWSDLLERKRLILLTFTPIEYVSDFIGLTSLFDVKINYWYHGTVLIAKVHQDNVPILHTSVGLNNQIWWSSVPQFVFHENNKNKQKKIYFAKMRLFALPYETWTNTKSRCQVLLN